MFTIMCDCGFGVARADLNIFYFQFYEFSHQICLTQKFHLVLYWAVTIELFVKKYIKYKIEIPN